MFVRSDSQELDSRPTAETESPTQHALNCWALFTKLQQILADLPYTFLICFCEVRRVEATFAADVWQLGMFFFLGSRKQSAPQQVEISPTTLEPTLPASVRFPLLWTETDRTLAQC
jgi:hypothetical protein